MRSAQEDAKLHTRTVIGLANPTPTVEYGDATIKKQGPGVFNLQFPTLRTLVSAMVGNNSGAPWIATCALQADNSLTVWCWNQSGSQVDPTKFSFIVTGYPK